MKPSIIRVHPTESLDLTGLAGLASSEGYPFVERALTEWDLGTNRFHEPGEGFFLAMEESDTVGICGLNVDPYVDDPSVGRLRHLYVVPGSRRRGVGRQLVESCLKLARGRFDRVRLRTSDQSAGRFYEALGFRPTEAPDATHVIDLSRSS